MQVYLFKIGEGTFGVAERWVREIRSISAQTLTTIPNAPSYVLGVAAVGGDVIPVMDLSLFVGSPALQVTTTTPMIICHVPAGTVGVVVSSEVGTQNLAEGLAAVGEHLRTWERLLLGVTPDGVGVINLERLLSNQGLLLAQDY